MGSWVLGIQTSEQPRGRRRTKMGRQVVELEIQREGNKPWGLRIVGGADVATVMKVEKVLGIDTPAYKAGLKAGDVLVEVQGELITMMTHPQVVNLIRGVRGNTRPADSPRKLSRGWECSQPGVSSTTTLS